jgi:hypothetical protein
MGYGSSVKGRLVDDAVRRFGVLAKGRQKAAEERPARVVTISRQLGAGGRRIAELMRERLGWPVYDREILEALAKRSGAHYRAQMFDALDETAQNEVEGILSTFLGRLDHHKYLFLLPRVILTLAQNDCIILGRAAHLFLPDSLRVRIEGSLERRMENMIRFEEMSAQAAKKEIERSDKSRARFIRQVCSALPEKYRWHKSQRMYDLTINTDCFSAAEAAEIVLCAARKRFNV